MPPSQTRKRRARPHLAPGINGSVKPVNSDPTNVASQLSPEAEPADLTTACYFRLIRELATEHGAPAHGWRVRVAMRLGIDQSFLSRLLNGGRAVVGPDSVDKAVAHLALRRAYFADEGLRVSYRDYLGAEPVLREPTFRGWQDFLSSPIGHEIAPHERTALASIVLASGDEPTAAFYEGVLYMLRNRITPAEMVRGVEKAAELAGKMQQNRNRP